MSLCLCSQAARVAYKPTDMIPLHTVIYLCYRERNGYFYGHRITGDGIKLYAQVSQHNKDYLKQQITVYSLILKGHTDHTYVSADILIILSFLSHSLFGITGYQQKNLQLDHVAMCCVFIGFPFSWQILLNTHPQVLQRL